MNDELLLEQAYQRVIESRSLENDVLGFNMNPDQAGALQRLQDAYVGNTVTLVRTVRGPDAETQDTYQGPTRRPVRMQALADEEVVTGVVTAIKGVREPEQMDKIFNRMFRGNRVDLVFVIDGDKEYNISQQLLRVKSVPHDYTKEMRAGVGNR